MFSFGLLPADILRSIILFIDHDDMISLALVEKATYEILKQPEVWQLLIRTRHWEWKSDERVLTQPRQLFYDLDQRYELSNGKEYYSYAEDKEFVVGVLFGRTVQLYDFPKCGHLDGLAKINVDKNGRKVTRDRLVKLVNRFVISSKSNNELIAFNQKRGIEKFTYYQVDLSRHERYIQKVYHIRGYVYFSCGDAFLEGLRNVCNWFNIHLTLRRMTQL